MKFARLLLAALLVSAVPAQAQTSPTALRLAGDPSARLLWFRTFASRGDDWVNDIIPLADDRFLAVGFLNRVDDSPPSDWIAFGAVLLADGSILADRHYGSGGGIDAFWTARQSEDGRIHYGGFTTRIGAGGIDALAITTRPDGAMLTERAFGGGGYDRFTSMAPAGDGFVYLGHSQVAGEERRRLFAVRIGGDGATVWERIIEGAESISPLYIEAASDGGFVVAGGIARGEDSQILILKLDGEGREQWRRDVGSPDASDINHGLALLPNGNIVVTGYSQSWGARGNDILVATLSPGGDLLRRERLGGAGDDRPILAKADAEGRVTIVGQTQSAGGGWDLILARVDARGSFEPGVITLGGPGDDQGTAVRPLADGSLMVAGYSNALGRGAQDAFVARIAAPTWQRPNPAFERVVIP